GRRRLQQHLAGCIRPQHLMRDRGLQHVDLAEALLRRLDALADRARHFLRFADAIADYLRARIADHHQRREAQILTALDHLGDAVDRHHLLFELQVLQVDAFRYCRHELKLQSCFARGIGERLHAPVIFVAAAIEHHALDSLVFGALCHQLADGLRRRDVAAVGFRALIHARCRYQRRAAAIVDNLRVDVRHAAENRQARTLRRACQLPAYALVDARPNLLLFRLTNHLPPAPVLPTFLRSTSPVYRIPLFL